MKRLVSILCLIAVTCLFATGCSVDLVSDVHFAFNKTGDGGKFSEYFKDFTVGKEFRTAITIKLTTNKDTPRNFKVVIDIPKTEKIKDMRKFRGLIPDSTEFDDVNHVNHLTFMIQGYKGAEKTVIQFVGTPIDEGTANLAVTIYDEDGNERQKYDTDLEFKRARYSKKRG